MGRGSKRNEKLKKKFAIGEHNDNKPITTNLNFKFDDIEMSYGVKIIKRNSNNQSKNEPEKKIDVSLLPHRLKNHGPADHKFDKIKYSASKLSYEKSGNLKAKITICNEILKEKSDSYTEEQKISEFNKKIPSLILDENIEKEKLSHHLTEKGYDVIFLGRGIRDKIICNHAIQKNAIIVTADVDFTVSLRDEQKYEPIYIDQKSDSLPENIRVICDKMIPYHDGLFS